MRPSITPLLAALALACDPATSPPQTQPDPRAADLCDSICEPGATCCTERFIAGDGASIGWTRRGAAMFAVDDPTNTTAVLTQFKRWIAESPPRAGLTTAMANITPLAGLATSSTPPRHHGALVLHRFAQTYRGLPVVGAGEHVSLTIAPGYGAVSVSGALADARDTYPGWDDAIAPQDALTAASELLAFDPDEIQPEPFTFGEPRLVALAEARTLAWEIEVARLGHSRGTLLLRAHTGAMLAFSPAAHFGPDADEQNFYGDHTSHPRIDASPTGEFLVTPPATSSDESPMRSDAALQDFFYRLQAS